MILFIECAVCCLLFTLAILPAQYKDPMRPLIEKDIAETERILLSYYNTGRTK